MAMRKLKKEGKDIETLIDALGSPAEAKEIRFNLDRENFVEIGTGILEGMPDWVAKTTGLSLEEPNHEGVRVNYDRNGHTGWFLLRKSLHDPVLPLNVEATHEGGIAEVLPLLKAYLEGFEGIDLSPLE